MVFDRPAFQSVVPHPRPELPSLDAVLKGLAVEVASLSPRTDLAIAVRDLTTGEYAGVNDEVLHSSASAAKVFWVAAAMKGAGTEAVAPHADPIFRHSDNMETGAVIDLIGPNAVNEFLFAAGLKHTALYSWGFGKPRKATNSPKEFGLDNYFTAKDSVDFLTRFDHGELLPPAQTEQLREWMKLSPRQGCGGWLLTRLPLKVREQGMHKGGWLPPGCCSSEELYNTLTEIGLVQVPRGHRYAVAILARRGKDFWGSQAPFVERASCLIYRTVSQDPTLDCRFEPRLSEAPADCD